MFTPILATKLYIPPHRPNVVSRPRLIQRLNEGLGQGPGRKLTLVSAPAGFGKTTLVSEWIAGSDRPAAWLSLDEEHNAPSRFLAYLVAALQTIAPGIGDGVRSTLQAPQPPPIETMLTALINDITTLPDNFSLVLDDYHVIEAPAVDAALAFLLKHMPPQMHLVIATREDPQLPLAHLRARGQLTELRAADLRFTSTEAAEFLNHVMGRSLSANDIAALETRTEGWIAGLHLAAISMRGYDDAASFIQSFTGSHRFVLDYLVEEVLHQQPESVQSFLLQTSILDRLCGPLCDAVTMDPSASGQETLEYLERANLFIVPLDNERRWYRYHHLFASFLRQRQRLQGTDVAELHIRASQWCEENGLEIKAFHHAVAANDVDRAARLVEGGGAPHSSPGKRSLPLQFRGAVAPVLHWLQSLPKAVLDARPALWVMYASALSMTGQLTGVEEKLQAAEAALSDAAEPAAAADAKTRNLIGHIAAIRALLAAGQRQVDAIIAQSRRALDYLHPDNLAVRTATTWKLGIAYQMQGDRAAARQAYTEAIATSQASGNTIINLAATIGLGNVQESQNQLHLAVETYRRVLHLAGDPPQPSACLAHLGLARICYEWNDLDAAQEHAQQSLQLARQMKSPDELVTCEIFLARLSQAQGDVAGAVAQLAKADQLARQHKLGHQMPEIADAQIRQLLHQSNLAAAADLAEQHDLGADATKPLGQARVDLARGEPAAALAVLTPWRQRAAARDWRDEVLKVMVLQAIALRVQGEADEAVHLLGNALAMAHPGGFIRTFVDEGPPMAQLLSEAAVRGIMPDYTAKLIAAFEAETQRDIGKSPPPPSPASQPLIEPLTPRELEVLQLIAEGLSNREIGERLFIALSTVKGHNQSIYGKLEVHRRTEAVARARELGLL